MPVYSVVYCNCSGGLTYLPAFCKPSDAPQSHRNGTGHCYIQFSIRIIHPALREYAILHTAIGLSRGKHMALPSKFPTQVWDTFFRSRSIATPRQGRHIIGRLVISAQDDPSRWNAISSKRLLRVRDYICRTASLTND